MFRDRLLFIAGYIALAVHVQVQVLFCVNCVTNNQNLPQLALHKNYCGDIHNISFPFRLKAHALDNCEDKYFELECENNRTVLYLLSGKYYVQAINYSSQLISLVDVGIQRNNCSSLPLHSLTHHNFTHEVDPYADPYVAAWNELAVLVSCEKQAESPLYIDTTSNVSTAFCENRGGGGGGGGVSSSSLKKHSYVLIETYGSLSWSDVLNLCSVDAAFPTRELRNPDHSYRQRNVTSLLEVHNILADGFDLYWEFYTYGQCKRQQLCFSDYPKNATAGACPRLSFLLFLDALKVFLTNHKSGLELKIIDIKKMAKGFKDKLGEGGYGSVYKGKLRSGDLVAIKVLGKPKANEQEFINEVATIGRIHHVNVVQLIGYCAERSKRALIYDFMPNGSLEKYIFSQEGYIPLSCKQMYEISLGVARGIEYLHRGCDMQILHFDIKPHNILLDENFTPKVSDFGLAKLYSTDDSIVNLTAARGTMGYMAPELFYKNIGGISYKADVYSFGMLLMEMASRKRNLTNHTSEIYFPSWIYVQFKEGRDIEMGETNEEEGMMVKKMIIVALWCIQMKPSDRPSMNKVVEMLEGNVEQLQMPHKPFLCPQEMLTEDHRIDTNPTHLPMPSGECINSITLGVSEP